MNFSRYTRLSTFLSIAGVATVFVGILVFFGTRKIEATLIGAGITFIVVLVALATLALTVSDEDHDPDKPVLH